MPRQKNILLTISQSLKISVSLSLVGLHWHGLTVYHLAAHKPSIKSTFDEFSYITGTYIYVLVTDGLSCRALVSSLS